MKNLILFGLLLSTSAFSENTIECEVVLQKNGSIVAQKTVKLDVMGQTYSTYEGSAFYIEMKKRRFLKKPVVTSQISFALSLNSFDRMGAFQFYRETEPNKHGILTHKSNMGAKITTPAGTENLTTIDTDYTVKTNCN